MSHRSVLFLTPYPQGAAPSQRFRFEQYLQFLAEEGWHIHFKSFWSTQAWNILYKPRNRRYKLLWLLWGFVRRFYHIFKYQKVSVVFIHREADPLGTPLFPFLLKKILRKKLVYDFDDAIWIPNASSSNRRAMVLKFWSNVRWMCSMADVVHAGNQFLADYASRYCRGEVKVVPTTIDTEHWHHTIRIHQPDDPFVVGWTGSHSTLHYLELVLPILKDLQEEIPEGFHVAVICDQKPHFPGLKFHFIPWRKETEVDDLLRFSVGLMPLTDDPWSQGKCGFKALQYMALGIPALVSPVGVNTRIVDHGINGFWCASEKEWKSRIKQLFAERELLIMLAQNCRPKIERFFSVNSQKKNFLDSFI